MGQETMGRRLLSCLPLSLVLSVLLLANSSVRAITEIDLGTTLVALKFKHGVIVAADTRTSVSGYVSNKFAKKINVVVNEPETSCAICRSGSAADTQWLAQHASHEFSIRRSLPSVSQVAHFLREKVRSESSLQASLICAGYDGTGRIFGISPGGSMWEEDVFCVSGSGSTFLLGHLDSLNLDPSRISQDKAIEMVKEWIQLSVARDGSSGGLVRIKVLAKGGVKEITFYPVAAPKEDLRGFARAITNQ